MTLLMWSGGCDSTLVLAEQLRLKNPIRTIGVTHTNIHVGEHLKKVRSNIIEWAKKRGWKWPHAEITLRNDHPENVDAYSSKKGLFQPGMWLSVASQFLEEEEDLCISYIRGDDVWHYMSAIRQAFDGLQAVAKRNGKLWTPLEWISKDQVIQGLKMFRGLYSKVWWCETPVSDKKRGGIKRCGECTPCITHVTALFKIKKNMSHQYLSVFDSEEKLDEPVPLLDVDEETPPGPAMRAVSPRPDVPAPPEGPSAGSRCPGHPGDRGAPG